MPSCVFLPRFGAQAVALSCWLAAITNHAADPPPTPFTDRAVAQVRRQADHLARGNRSVAAEFFSSLATANFVQSRLSSLNYSVLSATKQKLPSSVEECLRLNAGICGNHVAAFLEIARRLDLRARPVEFYFRGAQPETNHSHICVEVFYGDRWRLFDITWGSYFRRPDGALDDLADIAALRADRRSRAWAITNQSDLWYQQWKTSGLDPLEYLDDPRVDILRGRRGTIHLEPAERKGGRVVYRPLHQPNFVGCNRADRDYGALTVDLVTPPADATVAHLEVLGLAGVGDLVLTVGAQRIAVPFTELVSGQTRTIPFARPLGKQTVRLQATPRAPGGVAYLVFRTITLETR